MTEFSVAGRHVVVMGAARSGLAAATLLAERGARVTVSEARPAIPEAAQLQQAGVALELGGHRPATISSADLVVLSPGVSPRLGVMDRARRAGTPVISEVELAARWLRGRMIAVTGTKGKSTTTVLIGRMLDADGRRVQVGGNLGTALSSQVGASAPDVLHVVEVSSFQLELTERFHPWVAVCLNLSPDHLDRHASFEEYVAAKARIFANQVDTDVMVINADDPRVRDLARQGRARALPFAVDAAIDAGITVAHDTIVHRTEDDDRQLLPVSAVRLPGRHLLSDVLAASAVGVAAGVSAEAMRRAVEGFAGLDHALEHVAEVQGVQFINDSKATNIVAARAAIECFDRDLVVIMGGRFKGGDLDDLVPVLRGRVTGVVAIGEARVRFRDAFAGHVEIREAESMADAVRAAFALARPIGVVLLAPACASLDMFSDYAERGRVFKAEVARLTKDLVMR